VNKDVAKDNNADLTTRATAAKDALFDKKDEKVHETQADVYKGTYCVYSLPKTSAFGHGWFANVGQYI
jgi:hypothetical protein